MNGASILLVGAGGHARSCIDVIELEGSYRIGGLVGTIEEVGTKVLGHRVMGTDLDMTELMRSNTHAFVTVGHIKSPSIRIRLFEKLLQMQYAIPVVISPRAYVSAHSKVELGTIVMHGAVVNAGSRVGRNCILNSQSLVEHDVTVADHCHISTGAKLNSGVQIGVGTFIGSNVSVRQGVCIAEHCVIGMGQIVVKDCPSGAWLPNVREVS